MSSAEPMWSRVVRAPATVVAAALLGLVLLAASEGLVPRVAYDTAGKLWLELLPPVLDDDAVAAQLRNGLTTVLLIRVEAEGGTVAAARVDVRYELWDEVFLVTVRGPTSSSGEDSEPREPLRLADSSALGRWWKDLRLPGGAAAKTRRQEAPRWATVELEVVPFSQAEQLDTQRWFEEAVQRAERQRDPGGEEVSGGAGLERVLTTLMATSIRRRPLVSYRWQVPIEPEVGPTDEPGGEG